MWSTSCSRPSLGGEFAPAAFGEEFALAMAQVVAQGVLEFRHLAVAPLRIRIEGPGEDRGQSRAQRLRQRRLEAGGRGGKGIGHSGAEVWRLAADDLVEDRTEQVGIGPRPLLGAVTAGHLGWHVGRRAPVFWISRTCGARN